MISEIIEKVPPHNIEAEIAVLGSMLMGEDAISKAIECLDEYCFYKDQHKKVFTAIINLYNELGDEVLGILPFSQKESVIEGAPFIDLLVEVRAKLRTIKQWELADEIRVMLAQKGIILEDTMDKTIWKYS